MCRYLFETLLSLLLDIYPEMELLGRVVVSFRFEEVLCRFPIAAGPLYSPTSSMVSRFSAASLKFIISVSGSTVRCRLTVGVDLHPSDDCV